MATRISNVTGLPITSGYCFNHGDYYCETEKEAKAYIKSLGLIWKEEIKTIDTSDEWFYWSDWSEEEGEEEDSPNSFERWTDLYTDGAGLCFSDADPGL